MTTDLLEREEDTAESELTENVIHTQYWELPEESLMGWRPYTAKLDYRLFLGPSLLTGGRGLSLHKDLMGGIHGARGAGKSLLLSFLLAKKLRVGKPVWTNYPISFHVIEPDGSLTYYESRPLDFDKFYSFSKEVRDGAVGITELQYYVEARTSGKEQNRVAGYQIMQIRKTALSFLYDVQDRSWVDKRFGWSNDFDIECSDIAKMNYDRNAIRGLPAKAKTEYGDLRDGAYIRFHLEDTSGILTGTPYKKSLTDYGPYQFTGWKFWDIFPTHFIVDVYEAVHSLKKDTDRVEKKDALAVVLESVANECIAEGMFIVPAGELWERTKEKLGEDFNHRIAGGILKEWGVANKSIGGGSHRGETGYNFGALVEEKNEAL